MSQWYYALLFGFVIILICHWSVEIFPPQSYFISAFWVQSQWLSCCLLLTVDSPIADMIISMLLHHCICGKHGKVRVIVSFLHVTGTRKTEPHWLWSLTKFWLLLKEQFHPPRTSHSFQVCMIIQPNRTVNRMAERPVAMGKSSQWYFKNKTQIPISSSREVSATKVELLNYMSNLLPILVSMIQYWLLWL